MSAPNTVFFGRLVVCSCIAAVACGLAGFGGWIPVGVAVALGLVVKFINGISAKRHP